MLIEKRFQVLRELEQCKRSSAPWTLSMSTSIHSNHPKMVGKWFHLPFEVGMILPISVEQYQWKALSLLYIV